jgi:hypothetical protein
MITTLYKHNPVKLSQLQKSIHIFIDICNNNVNNLDINYIDITGCSPLGWAVILGKDELVKELLNKGANPNIKILAYLFQVIKIDWILEPALSIITKLLPSHLKQFLTKEKILHIFKTLRNHGYMNSEGIQIKYIADIMYELNTYNCFSQSMIQRWKTKEDFIRKVRLSFWFFPKIADKDNYFIQKFFKNSEVSNRFRLELLEKFTNNPADSYKKIIEYIPINKNNLDPFLNDAWSKIVIPELIHNMIVKVICLDKNNNLF